MMETAAHDATMLLVNVIRADGLPSTGADGTVDTYCELSLGSVVKTSSMKPDDRNPAFDEYFLLYVGEHTMLSLLSSSLLHLCIVLTPPSSSPPHSRLSRPQSNPHRRCGR